jgi:hypothetical protein
MRLTGPRVQERVSLPPARTRSSLAADVVCTAVACAGSVLVALALLDASAYGRFLISLLVR